MSDSPTRTSPPGDGAGDLASRGGDLTAGLADAVTDAGPPIAPPGYELLEEIGRGGMGVVYRAQEITLNRGVAIKLLRDRYPADSAVARRFVEEAQITSQLQHPGVPPVHQIGTLPDGRPFLVMKLIKGRTLEELLKLRTSTADDRGRFLAVFEQVCQAVAAAHSHRVIHRDLKPANVMVGAFGEVQVMDWGLAKLLTAAGTEAEARYSGTTTAATEIRTLRDSDGSLTQAGSVMGTPAYMPPEQAGGEIERIDERADVFGLGAILCVILTGEPPYTEKDADSLRLKAIRGQLGECRTRLDGCGAEPELVALAQQCLASDPSDRPSSAGEVAKAVADLRAAADERARQAEVERVRAEGELRAAEVRTAEQRKRRRVQAALGLAFTGLVLLGGAFAWWQDRQAAERRAERRAERDLAAAKSRQAAEIALDQADAALRAERMAEADAALSQAELRLVDAPDDDLRGRYLSLRADRDVVRELERLAELGLRYVANTRDTVSTSASRHQLYPEAFLQYGLAVGLEPAADTGAKVRASRVAGPLADGLNFWFFIQPERAGLREAADAADPNPYRVAVRAAVAARDGPEVRQLAAKADAANLSPGFAVGLSLTLPPADGLRVMQAAWSIYQNSYQLALQLGFIHQGSPREQSWHIEALGWSRAAVALRPDNAVAHIVLGDAYRTLARYPAADAAYRQAIRLDPTYFMPHISLAQTLEMSGDRAAAIPEFRKGLEMNPRFVVGHHMLGSALLRMDDLDGAIEIFQKAVQLAPQDATSHERLGYGLWRKREFEKALPILRQAVQLGPKYLNAHNTLGLVLRDMGKLDEAIAAFRTLFEIDPKYGPARGNLVRGLIEKAVLLSEKGERANAIAICRQAIEVDPKFATAHLLLADNLQLQGDYPAAIAEYAEAIRLNEKLTRAHNNLAWLLATGPDGVRDGKRAIEYATRACELTKWTQPEWIDTLAAAYAEAGNFDRAVEYQKKAVSSPELKKQAGDEIQQRLDLYVQKKPYRDPALARPELAPPPRELR